MAGEARTAAAGRPQGELRADISITPPGSDEVHQISIDLRTMSLSERQLVKRALAKMTDPDWAEILLVHAWVVWRRTNPTASLSSWMDNIMFGDVMDGLDMDPTRVQWDTTPDEYDPE